MKLPTFLATYTAALVLGGTGFAQSFTAMPGDVYNCNDITPDGEIIVGSGTSGAYYWRWQTDPAPTYIGGKGATAVSDDGMVIAGYITDPSGATTRTVAARWTLATGWVSLGAEMSTASCGGGLSSASDMSADGSTIVGLTWVNLCSAYSYMWDQTNGVQLLEYLGNGGNNNRAIAADGSVIVGFAQGNSQRTLATWDPSDLSGNVPDMDAWGEYWGVSNDGRFLVGSRNGYAFYELDGVETNIGNLNPGWQGRARDISETGGTIVGNDVFGAGSEAWVWNQFSGIVQLQSRLTNLGVPGVPTLGYVKRMTPDGRFALGGTAFQGDWIAGLAPGPGALPYGCGLFNPPQSLTHVAGSASIGGVLRLGVDDPTGSMAAPAVGVVSYALQPDPNYPCGTLLPGFAMFGTFGELLISLAPPNPIMQQISPTIWTTPGNSVTVDFFVPFDTNLFGVELYAQGALFSPSTSRIGLTNGMRIAIGLN